MLYNYIATASFGLEATVKREVAGLGFGITGVLDGRIDFEGGFDAIPKANLWLRSADRLLLKMGEFDALTFDELFEGTKALPWDEFITIDGKFTVTGKSIKSQLFSVPDCQSIVKKAVVEKLKLKYKIDYFEETGPEYKIQVALLKNRVTLTIDTTGPGLHKRGYRPAAAPAPLKETMAAAMLELSYWRKDRVLCDPFCGGGTIAIEAALMAKNIAPGLNRTFVSEEWPQIPAMMWKNARGEAKAAIDTRFNPEIYAFDIDPRAISASERNAKNAGVRDCIRFETRGVGEVEAPVEYGVVVTNPPYGERIGEISEIRGLYKELKRAFGNGKWSVYVITSDEEFEKYYGKKADAKRKLYSGMIKTDYYQFFGERPPKIR